MEEWAVIENAYYSPEIHGPYEMFDLGDFTLEEGPTLRGCQLAYATFGTLNDARDNAIFISTWYSGMHQIWADAYIGPERALNPEKYFIVVAEPDRQRSVHLAAQHGRSVLQWPVPAREDRRRCTRPGAATPGAVRHRGVAARDRRLYGGAADLRVGGQVPG